jgi:hypothetical protein
MCLNCGCGDYNDDMGDRRNIILKVLAEAAIAGNDGDPKALLEEMRKALGRITPEELQEIIDQLKGQQGSGNEDS